MSIAVQEAEDELEADVNHDEDITTGQFEVVAQDIINLPIQRTPSIPPIPAFNSNPEVVQLKTTQSQTKLTLSNILALLKGPTE